LRLQQERCAHCQELYTESENKRGSCRYSPDVVRQGIDCVSCLSCAKCLLYHCHYEDENFSEEEICTCADTDGHLAKRWLGLSLLAVLVPCLCLYPVLTACYTCGRACHACGGKHVPVWMCHRNYKMARKDSKWRRRLSSPNRLYPHNNLTEKGFGRQCMV